MKLQEILKESEKSPQQKIIENFTKKFGWIASHGASGQGEFYFDSDRELGQQDEDDEDENTPISVLFDEHGHITDEFKTGASFTIFVHDGYELNMAEDFPGMISAHELSLRPATRQGSKSLSCKNIRDWIPATDELRVDFGEADVTSLDGIEKQRAHQILIDVYNDESLKCGVLRFLKCANLEDIHISPVRSSYDNDADIRKLNDILMKHLKDKDISECMDELIEAGLKEYAKL